jgi:hypothetical protein
MMFMNPSWNVLLVACADCCSRGEVLAANEIPKLLAVGVVQQATSNPKDSRVGRQ